jgi:hypothetical protein
LRNLKNKIGRASKIDHVCYDSFTEIFGDKRESRENKMRRGGERKTEILFLVKVAELPEELKRGKENSSLVCVECSELFLLFFGF